MTEESGKFDINSDSFLWFKLENNFAFIMISRGCEIHWHSVTLTLSQKEWGKRLRGGEDFFQVTIWHCSLSLRDSHFISDKVLSSACYVQNFPTGMIWMSAPAATFFIYLSQPTNLHCQHCHSDTMSHIAWHWTILIQNKEKFH